MSAVVQRVASDRGVAAEPAADPSCQGGQFLELSLPASHERGSMQRRWLKRLGAVGFAFFLLKGLFWLTVPALLAYFAQR